MQYSQDSKESSEIIIGIIGPIGCNRQLVKDNIKAISKQYSYEVKIVKVSSLIDSCITVDCGNGSDDYKRVLSYMKAGKNFRLKTKDNAFLAKRAAIEIAKLRGRSRPHKRVIYVIDSLKHPEEVNELKNIYGRGFYLFAIHSSEESRMDYLKDYCNISDAPKRDELIKLDKDDEMGHGQSTSKAFHLADFFLTENGNNIKIYNSLDRFFEIIFGHPFKTPTFHEYAMYMAYTASIRSSDMSRQVGAVVTKGTDVISTGANECPKAGGGSYWPLFDDEKNLIYDVDEGRDYTHGYDRNASEKQIIIDKIKDGVAEVILKQIGKTNLKKNLSAANYKKLAESVLGKLETNIKLSGLEDITEYGRVVHAEMDAILGCARRGISCHESVLFCTTYPCHNCAKHIISSGVKQVVYIEPYPKSKAYEMHRDSIRTTEEDDSQKVLFLPFVGVGPRQYVNFFSLSLSIGGKVRRKDANGIDRAPFDKATAHPRVKMFNSSYIKNEKSLVKETKEALKAAGL